MNSPIPKTQSPRKLVGIYTRKSTTMGLEQDFNSLDAQRDACMQYILSQAHDGWDPIQPSYDDGGFTGANTDRPAFQRLMSDVDAGKVNVIVVYKLDRLSRSLLDFTKLMERLNERGVGLVSVTQNFSTANAVGRWFLNMLMSFSEFEREMIAERTRDKIAAARRRGKWTGGNVPLGYDLVRGKLALNEAGASIVREAFKMYVARRSVLEVVRALRERELAPKPSRLGRALPWTKDKVARLLRTPVYAGFIRSGDTLYPGEHAAIVEEQTWREVQEILDAQRFDTSHRAGSAEFLLRALLRCGACDSAMQPASSKKGEKTYRYYRCATRDKRGAEACPTKALPAEAVEAFAVEKLHRFSLDKRNVIALVDRLNARGNQERQRLLLERERLASDIGKVSARLQKVSTLGEARGDLTVVNPGAQAVSSELAVHEAKLRDVEISLLALRDAEADVAWISHALGNFERLWVALTLENRHRLLSGVIDRVVVDEAKGRIQVFVADLGLPALVVDEWAAA